MKQSYVDAYAWYSVAASNGYEDAAKDLKTIEWVMTSSQIKEGKQLAREILGLPVN